MISVHCGGGAHCAARHHMLIQGSQIIPIKPIHPMSPMSPTARRHRSTTMDSNETAQALCQAWEENSWEKGFKVYLTALRHCVVTGSTLLDSPGVPNLADSVLVLHK